MEVIFLIIVGWCSCLKVGVWWVVGMCMLCSELKCILFYYIFKYMCSVINNLILFRVYLLFICCNIFN